ncbi:nuclear transport factor 2 family protein [Siculibacillus lacustris]|uniref:Nuclear transport factor 2 family protein n=1 Tax=Siculibacillus lacustris TaxID=1549641 RepID=A0A4Q9VQA0_9HYPH|nr:nuclear transport factor 2 family protein [Siculibacillus lacustris]TBW37969.1 nuclear transport factor 2 family protein [Siculibacillus lacustris]
MSSRRDLGVVPGTRFLGVIDLERAALARWCRGDPSGFLELADPEVTYFDPFLARRLDGLAALTAYYEGLRGRIAAASWEMIDPRLDDLGDAAILTFRFRSLTAAGFEHLWNATEVWVAGASGPRLRHTHWSIAAAVDAAP